MSVKESKIQSDRRGAALKKLAVKCMDLSEVPDEVRNGQKLFRSVKLCSVFDN